MHLIFLINRIRFTGLLDNSVVNFHAFSPCLAVSPGQTSFPRTRTLPVFEEFMQFHLTVLFSSSPKTFTSLKFLGILGQTEAVGKFLISYRPKDC